MIERVICSSPLGSCGTWVIPQNHYTGASQIGLEKVQLRSLRDSFGTPAHAEFAIDTAHLGLNRIGGDDKGGLQLSVRLPGDQKTQYPLLLPAQWLDEPSLVGVLWGMWQGLLCGGRWSISSLRGPALLLLEGCQQAQHRGPGNGYSWSTGFAILQSCQERLEHVFHRWTSIQIHTDVSLWFRQREQTSRDMCRLLALPCLMQSHDPQCQKLDGGFAIPGPIKVVAPTFQHLDGLG